MATTIRLDDALASRLGSEARSRRMSVEELSRRLLIEAVQRIEGSSDWDVRNQRRIELIRKSTNARLTSAEQAELDELQAELYQRMEAMDQELLSRLNELEDAVLPQPAAVLSETG